MGQEVNAPLVRGRVSSRTRPGERAVSILLIDAGIGTGDEIHGHHLLLIWWL